MRVKKYKIPIYQGNLVLILTKDLNKVSKEYNLPNLKDYGAVTFKNQMQYREYIIAFEKDSISGSIIAHEVVHLINFIFIDCGIELDRVNDENQAYLSGYFFQRIEKFLKIN